MPILSFSQVSKQFGQQAPVLLNVSFSIEPGELVVLTGQTGVGKTTLMKLLTREYKIDEGEIFFQEIAVHKIKSGSVHKLRRRIGVVFQDYRLLPDLNVWENIATPLYIVGKSDQEIEQRVSDLLNLINLTHKAADFPSQLSGGESQRVAIARALALGPELIFADEPTGNLDPLTSKSIAVLLDKINELGTTIIISTHDLTLLDYFASRRHLKLENSQIVESNKQEKIIKKIDNSTNESKDISSNTTSINEIENQTNNLNKTKIESDEDQSDQKKSINHWWTKLTSIFKRKNQTSINETELIFIDSNISDKNGINGEPESEINTSTDESNKNADSIMDINNPQGSEISIEDSNTQNNFTQVTISIDENSSNTKPHVLKLSSPDSKLAENEVSSKSHLFDESNLKQEKSEKKSSPHHTKKKKNEKSVQDKVKHKSKD